MSSIGVWQVGEAGPARLRLGGVDLEEHLEAWIEADPNLVQLGLTIIARQFILSAGRIDLLALDSAGRWVIMEIKRGQVDRDTVAQLQDYAAALAELDGDTLQLSLSKHLHARGLDLDALLRERDAMDSLDPSSREIEMIAVGIGASAGLERMSRFLQDRFQMPLRTVFFSAFITDRGERVLVREIPEDDVLIRSDQRRWQASSMGELEALVAGSEYAPVLASLLQAAHDRGLRTRRWKRSIMVTPPHDARRCLYTVWPAPESSGLRVYIEHKAFFEFFGVPEEAVIRALGRDRYRVLGLAEASAFADAIRALVPISSESIEGGV